MLLHDLAMPGSVLPLNPLLKTIFCLTEWHANQFAAVFPTVAVPVKVISYGIDDTHTVQPSDKFALGFRRFYAHVNFIYASFPNRGLLHLLRLFSKLRTQLPNARLDIFVRFDLAYYEHCGEEILEVKRLLLDLRCCVTNHGWVSGEKLASFWKKADIWLYPCTFQETFCKVAQEAALHGVLAIAPPLAALQESIGDRGVLIPGDPSTPEWQEKAIETCVDAVGAWEEVAYPLIQKNYAWAAKHAYSAVVSDFTQKMGLGSWTESRPFEPGEIVQTS